MHQILKKIKKNKNNYPLILFLSFIIWRTLLFIALGVSLFLLVPKPAYLALSYRTPFNALLWPWASFDGVHYLDIAKFGYAGTDLAFFPVYPFVIKLLAFIIKDYLLSGLIISNVSSIILIVILYKLFSLDFSKNTVTKGLTLLFSFASAFFFCSVYSESLFLCFAAGTLLAARKRNYGLVLTLGILTTATRFAGIFIIPALLIIWVRNKDDYKRLIFIFLTSLGLLCVMTYDFFARGDFLYFVHVQTEFNNNRTVNGIVTLPQVMYRYLKIFTSTPLTSYEFFIAGQEFVFSCLALVSLFFVYSHKRLEYLVFTAGVILLPTMTGTFASMPRYILAGFPLFFYVAKKLNFDLYLIILVLVLFLQLINAGLFVNGFWVA